MPLIQILGDAVVIEKFVEVTTRQHKIEHLIAVGLLNRFQVSLERFHFLRHPGHLLGREAIAQRVLHRGAVLAAHGGGVQMRVLNEEELFCVHAPIMPQGGVPKLYHFCPVFVATQAGAAVAQSGAERGAHYGMGYG